MFLDNNFTKNQERPSFEILIFLKQACQEVEFLSKNGFTKQVVN
jgi:hypothetical protein